MPIDDEEIQRVSECLNLSPIEINQHYQSALKNRLEIPPMLMRRLIIDAIEIIRIMSNEMSNELPKSDEKLQAIARWLNELEFFNRLFNQHC